MIRAAALVVVLGGMVAGPVSARQSPVTCRSTKDPVAQAVLSYLRRLMTTTDPKLMATRDSTYRLPVVPVSDVVLVTDRNMCKRAAGAVQRDLQTSHLPPFQNVVLVRVGAYYVVSDPDVRRGEYTFTRVLDSHFQPGPVWIMS